MLLCITACTKRETQSIDLSGDITGTINTYLEYGPESRDRANVAVSLIGSNLPAVYTNSDGKYTIKDVPLGRYTVSISKDGYGTYTYDYFNFIGGDKAKDISTFLRQKSSTKIIDYSLSFSANRVFFSGTIAHVYPQSGMNSYPYSWPGLSIYFSFSPSISSTSYNISSNFYTDQNMPTHFSDSLYVSFSTFPHGSTVYAIIYGRTIGNYLLYNYETGTFYDPCQGEPSTIKSIVIP